MVAVKTKGLKVEVGWKVYSDLKEEMTKCKPTVCLEVSAFGCLLYVTSSERPSVIPSLIKSRPTQVKIHCPS